MRVAEGSWKSPLGERDQPSGSEWAIIQAIPNAFYCIVPIILFTVISDFFFLRLCVAAMCTRSCNSSLCTGAYVDPSEYAIRHEQIPAWNHPLVAHLRSARVEPYSGCPPKPEGRRNAAKLLESYQMRTSDGQYRVPSARSEKEIYDLVRAKSPPPGVRG